MKGKWCASVIGATLFACSLASGAAWGQRIHVLVVGDTSKIDGRGMANGIAESAKVDIENVEEVFAANIPEHQLESVPASQAAGKSFDGRHVDPQRTRRRERRHCRTV